MQRYIEKLVKLNVNFDEEVAIDMVLNSLPSCYDQFILTYHLKNRETTLAQLHNLLQTTKSGLKEMSSTPPINATILAIDKGKWKKRKDAPKSNWKKKVHAGSSRNGQ